MTPGQTDAHSMLHLGLSPLSDHFEKSPTNFPQAPSVILITHIVDAIAKTSLKTG